jgi:hypothetical protein
LLADREAVEDQIAPVTLSVKRLPKDVQERLEQRYRYRKSFAYMEGRAGTSQGCIRSELNCAEQKILDDVVDMGFDPAAVCAARPLTTAAA